MVTTVVESFEEEVVTLSITVDWGIAVTVAIVDSVGVLLSRSKQIELPFI